MADLTMTADKFTYSFKCIFDNEITIVDDEWQFTSNLKFWFGNDLCSFDNEWKFSATVFDNDCMTINGSLLALKCSFMMICTQFRNRSNNIKQKLGSSLSLKRNGLLS